MTNPQKPPFRSPPAPNEGPKLPQIKRVEKWQARDGTYHDSLEAAEDYQLCRELNEALKACVNRPEDQARHLLCHFDIVRKGDTPKVFYGPPPTTEWHRAPNTVCTTCYLVTGGLIGCLLTLAILWLR